MLKTRFFTIFIIFILLSTVFFTPYGLKAEVFEQKGIFVDVPSNMMRVESDLPLVIFQFKFKNKDFPTVTITSEKLNGNENALPQEIEASLKETYTQLGFNVISSNHLKSQQISTYNSNLYQIEYTYSGILFVSLVNIFTYNDRIHYITIINKVDNNNPLKETLKFQENFLNYVSLEKKSSITNNNFTSDTSKSSDKSKSSNNTATGVLGTCIAMLASAMFLGKKKS